MLVFGDRGTGKSTAVRALAALLPPMRALVGCRYGCDPADASARCEDCAALKAKAKPKTHLVPVPVVDLPLGATEDRVVGALDLERALTQGVKAFEPGLLARAHRGFLYIDEVNLLEDHLVDLLIDVAASGENVVEREGLSVRHPARFVLVGSGNPEEGELRPQLLDRFGLSVEVRTPDRPARTRVRGGAPPRRLRARPGRPSPPNGTSEDERVRKRIVAGAQAPADGARCADAALERAAQLCMALGTDGLRGELTLMRAARALAALRRRRAVGDAHLQRARQAGAAPPPAPQSARRHRRQRARRARAAARCSARERGDAPAADPAWADAVWAATLFAVDPHGLGGVALRAGAGPVRDRWTRAAARAAAGRARRGAACPRTSATSGCSAGSTWRPRCRPGGRWRSAGCWPRATAAWCWCRWPSG